MRNRSHHRVSRDFFSPEMCCRGHRTQARMSEQLDKFYKGAKDQGFRARSAFKLIQVDEECGIFQGVKRAVDLCAAPGSWSQVLSHELYRGVEDIPLDGGDDPRVVSIDLQHLAPIPGVKILQGDITAQETYDAIIQWFKGEPADLVVSDGAPDVSGLHELDEYAQLQLMKAAIDICRAVLRRGTGTFVAKVFVGQNYELLHKQLQVLFKDVSLIKPTSSRPRSAEHFVCCQGFHPPEDDLLGDPDAPEAIRDAERKAAELLKDFADDGNLSTIPLSTQDAGSVQGPFSACLKR